jgi:hypothetical protein
VRSANNAATAAPVAGLAAAKAVVSDFCVAIECAFGGDGARRGDGL